MLVRRKRSTYGVCLVVMVGLIPCRLPALRLGLLRRSRLHPARLMNEGAAHAGNSSLHGIAAGHPLRLPL